MISIHELVKRCGLEWSEGEVVKTFMGTRVMFKATPQCGMGRHLGAS